MTQTPLQNAKQSEFTTYRDTVESIWVAIILAFVLRAFVVEAFVIPTGSMAPRLMGEHWDLQCPTCGYEFAHGASTGLAESTPRSQRPSPQSAVCPNCRSEYPRDREEYISGGDRVLVLKYLYQFSPPQPWDVVVFRNPQDNRQNYIKRLIGLPGETIEIVHGDIFVAADANGPRSIRRKPRRAQDAMWQVVFDNDYRPDPSSRWFAPARCPSWEPRDGGGGWDAKREFGRLFSFAGGRQAELVFQSDRDVFMPHYGYNPANGERMVIDPDVDVCGDLNLSGVWFPRDASAGVTFNMSSLGYRFSGTVGADGNATLSWLGDRGGASVSMSVRLAPLELNKGHQISLVHADFRVSLCVDGREILHSEDPQYPGPDVYHWIKARLDEASEHRLPTPSLSIAASGGPSDLRHVKIMRDEYYTSHQLDSPPNAQESPLGAYALEINKAHSKAGLEKGGRTIKLGPDERRFHEVTARLPGWGTTGRPIQLASHPDDPDLDEFFVLGDNSPQSLDGRGWVTAAPSLRLFDDEGNFQYQLGTVPRYNMIGRALFVYLPSGFRLPGLPVLPIVPNVGKMRLIR